MLYIYEIYAYLRNPYSFPIKCVAKNVSASASRRNCASCSIGI